MNELAKRMSVGWRETVLTQLSWVTPSSCVKLQLTCCVDSVWTDIPLIILALTCCPTCFYAPLVVPEMTCHVLTLNLTKPKPYAPLVMYLLFPAPWYIAIWLCASVRSSWSTAFAFRQMSSTVTSASSPQHFCDPHIFCRRTNSLEFTAWSFVQSSCWLRQFRRDSETYLFAGHSKH